MKNKLMTLMMLAMVSSLVFGCAKKADTNKSVDQIKTEVQAMSASDLEAYAKAYANQILAQKGELQKISDQVKSLSPTEIFSEKAKSLKDQLSTVGSEVSKLTERYEVYAKRFQELGGDVAKIKIS